MWGLAIRKVFVVRSGSKGAALPSNNRAPRVSLARLALALLAILGVFAYTSAFRGRYIDDAYIQLQYARQLIEHRTWGFFPGRVANTATSPLNVLLTALFGLFRASLVDAVVWLTALELLALLLLLLLISRALFDGYYFGAFAFIAFATNPLLLSTIGMEAVLYTLLLVASVYLFLSRRWLPLAIVLGLLTLTRPEGALLALIYLAIAPVSRVAKGKLALAYVATLLPWHLYSWIQLGSLVPDTLLIKTRQSAWLGRSFYNGVTLYWEYYLLPTAASFSLLPLGPLAFWRSDRKVRQVATTVATYGLLHYLAYSAMRVPPYHWYYLHQLVPAVFIGSLGVACLLRRVDRAQARFARVAGGVALLLPTAGLLALVYAQGFPLEEPPIHTNWATPEHYREIGAWLNENVEPAATLELTGEIGTLAFYSDRYLVNEFSDMNLPSAIIAGKQDAGPPLLRWLWRANTLWRREQPPLPKPTYVLRHVLDEGRGGKHVYSGEELVKAWDTPTTWAPRGRLYLVRVSPAVRP